MVDTEDMGGGRCGRSVEEDPEEVRIEVRSKRSAFQEGSVNMEVTVTDGTEEDLANNSTTKSDAKDVLALEKLCPQR